MMVMIYVVNCTSDVLITLRWYIYIYWSYMVHSCGWNQQPTTSRGKFRLLPLSVSGGFPHLRGCADSRWPTDPTSRRWTERRRSVKSTNYNYRSNHNNIYIYVGSPYIYIYLTLHSFIFILYGFTIYIYKYICVERKLNNNDWNNTE